MLFWLNDKSNDNVETEFFLDRRLKDISKISSFKKPLSDVKNTMVSLSFSLWPFRIVCNICPTDQSNSWTASPNNPLRLVPRNFEEA